MMNDKEDPVRAKNLVVNRPKKKWKEIVEKDILARSLKITSAQNRSLLTFVYENRLSPRSQGKNIFRRMKERMDGDDDGSE